jgi:hypothetical protein
MLPADGLNGPRVRIRIDHARRDAARRHRQCPLPHTHRAIQRWRCDCRSRHRGIDWPRAGPALPATDSRSSRCRTFAPTSFTDCTDECGARRTSHHQPPRSTNSSLGGTGRPRRLGNCVDTRGRTTFTTARCVNGHIDGHASRRRCLITFYD